MTTNEFIFIDEGFGYEYPAHEEECRRLREFWQSPCNPAEDGGLWGNLSEWEKKARNWTLRDGVWGYD